jgi:hypothetical protein
LDKPALSFDLKITDSTTVKELKQKILKNENLIIGMRRNGMVDEALGDGVRVAEVDGKRF